MPHVTAMSQSTISHMHDMDYGCLYNRVDKGPGAVRTLS